MQDKVKKKKNSILRKMVLIVCFPVFIGIWITGWVLVQSSNSGQKPNPKHKTNLETKIPINKKITIQEPTIVA